MDKDTLLRANSSHSTPFIDAAAAEMDDDALLGPAPGWRAGPARTSSPTSSGGAITLWR